MKRVMWCLVYGPDASHMHCVKWFERKRDAVEAEKNLEPWRPRRIERHDWSAGWWTPQKIEVVK